MWWMVLAACSGGGEATDSASTTETAAPTGTTGDLRVVNTDGGSWWVRYTPAPDPIPLNDYFSLELEAFTDAALTAPATGLAMSFDAGMPAHGHGMNVQPTVSDNGDGSWVIDGILFHMEGDWAMVVSLTGADGLETATFDVDCCQ